MENLKLELARESNIPFMLKLWRNTPGIGLGAGGNEMYLSAFIQRNPDTCLLLKAHDSIVGTVLRGFGGKRGYIYHLAVHSYFQRQGWGKRLLQEAVIKLRVLKAGKLNLFVFKSNPGAMLFYEKQDWIKRDDIEVFSFNDLK